MGPADGGRGGGGEREEELSHYGKLSSHNATHVFPVSLPYYYTSVLMQSSLIKTCNLLMHLQNTYLLPSYSLARVPLKTSIGKGQCLYIICGWC